jgi:hypothetical protein
MEFYASNVVDHLPVDEYPQFQYHLPLPHNHAENFRYRQIETWASDDNKLPYGLPQPVTSLWTATSRAGKQLFSA